MDTLETVLAHYGIRGMRWGVRGAGRRGSKPAASTDSVRAKTYKQKVKKGKTDALSTKELQELVARMNLEQQYSRLSPSKKAKGGKFIADILLGAGKQQATKIVNDRLTKQMESVLKK